MNDFASYADALEALKISNESFEDIKKEALMELKATGLAVGGILAIAGGFIAITSIVDKFGKVKDQKKFDQSVQAIISDIQSDDKKSSIITDALKCNMNAKSELEKVTLNISNKVDNQYKKYITIHTAKDYGNEDLMPPTSINELVVKFLKSYDKGTLRPMTNEKGLWNFYIISVFYCDNYPEIWREDPTTGDTLHDKIWDYFDDKYDTLVRNELKHTKYLKNMIGELDSIDMKDGSDGMGFQVYALDKSSKAMGLLKSYVK